MSQNPSNMHCHVQHRSCNTNAQILRDITLAMAASTVDGAVLEDAFRLRKWKISLCKGKLQFRETRGTRLYTCGEEATVELKHLYACRRIMKVLAGPKDEHVTYGGIGDVYPILVKWRRHADIDWVNMSLFMLCCVADVRLWPRLLPLLPIGKDVMAGATWKSLATQE